MKNFKLNKWDAMVFIWFGLAMLEAGWWQRTPDRYLLYIIIAMICLLVAEFRRGEPHA